MSVSPISDPESTFVCDCYKWMRSACTGEPFYEEHEGKRYCVLHFPHTDKSADFEKVLQRKLKSEDFNFPGVWFPDPLSLSKFAFLKDVDFRSATFTADVRFGRAAFSGVANFSAATFKAQADFHAATFSAAAVFKSATFSGVAHFKSATFSALANFHAATFSAIANFSDVVFNGDAKFIHGTLSGKTDFSGVTFKAYVEFAGNNSRPLFCDASSLDLRFSRIEKPDHLSFQTLSLRPHWFVNIDVRKFEFINVEWRHRASEEIKDLSSGGFTLSTTAHQLLSITCRQLAVNAEDNHRYKEASDFRYLAMDFRRRERWHGLAFWKLSWWYWLASGYGERMLQAFVMLMGILLMSAWLYTHVGFARWEPKFASESDAISAKRDDVGVPLKFSRAVAYSADVITLQKPEPRPATTAAQAVVRLETILGPVQAALLALAIRRRFMR